MARHYKQSKKRNRDSHKMMMPRDMAEVGNGDNTQLYHEGKKYYGPGYGHIANMPPYADLGMYPKSRKYLKTNDYPDTIEEIDTDNDFNYGQLEKHRSDSMY